MFLLSGLFLLPGSQHQSQQDVHSCPSEARDTEEEMEVDMVVDNEEIMEVDVEEFVKDLEVDMEGEMEDMEVNEEDEVEDVILG
ncbi:hypothetical protein HGM15179_007494 [Zosterops borbonicus]|uniref:Uncharacterized protein n=1 Tax=Zosterops borbonicus TaxID=364589 RepID=A0A8K1GIM8_9PASS|nr:hypothetical protein HGM15179_007494 [Zosterops borbonicus]